MVGNMVGFLNIPSPSPKKQFLPSNNLEFNTEHAHEKTDWLVVFQPSTLLRPFARHLSKENGPSAHHEVTDMHSPGKT